VAFRGRVGGGWSAVGFELDFGGAGAAEVLRGMAEGAHRRMGPADIGHHFPQDARAVAVHDSYRRRPRGHGLVEEPFEILARSFAVEADEIELAGRFLGRLHPHSGAWRRRR